MFIDIFMSLPIPWKDVATSVCVCVLFWQNSVDNFGCVLSLSLSLCFQHWAAASPWWDQCEVISEVHGRYNSDEFDANQI